MPFVTEEIWSLLPGERGLLAVSPLAGGRRARCRDEEAEAALDRFIEAVGALRSYRDEVGAKPGTPLRGVLARRGLRRPARPARAASAASSSVDGAARTRSRWRRWTSRAAWSRVLPSDAFDAEEEERRREAERERLQDEIERLERKLANEGFVNKAPAEVVEGERRKLEELPRGAAAPRDE